MVMERGPPESRVGLHTVGGGRDEIGPVTEAAYIHAPIMPDAGSPRNDCAPTCSARASGGNARFDSSHGV